MNPIDIIGHTDESCVYGAKDMKDELMERAEAEIAILNGLCSDAGNLPHIQARRLQLLKDLRAELESQKAEIAALREAMQGFPDRCNNGDVRSEYTECLTCGKPLRPYVE